MKRFFQFRIVCLAGLAGLLIASPLLALTGGGSRGAKSAQSYLGVDIVDVEPEQVSVLHLRDAKGAEIIRVDHDGPAGKAGLREHDVVLRINDQSIENEEQFRHTLRETPAGRSITLTLSRDGQILTVSTQLANRVEVERRAWGQHFTVPEPASTAPAASGPDDTSVVNPPMGRSFMAGHLLSVPYTGLVLDSIGTQLAEFFGARNGRGLLVHSVEPNSPAAVAGVHAGDVVIRVNGSTVASKSEWSRAMHDAKGRPAEVTLLRDHHEVIVMVATESRKHGLLQWPGSEKGSEKPEHAEVCSSCVF